MDSESHEQIEAELLDDDRLRRIVTSGIVGLVSWEIGGRIRDANNRFLEIAGYTRDELEAWLLDWKLLTPEEWQSSDADAVAQLRSTGTASPIEKELLRKDGTRGFVQLRSATVENDPTRVLSLVVDITERKRVERERDALLESERTARAQAEAAIHARDDILAIVSHDLRNPLNTLSLGLRSLELPLSEDQKAVHLGVLRRTIDGMNRLIEDLLDVNQISNGKLRVEPAPVDLSSLVEDARAMFEPQALQKNQHFECRVIGAPAMVLGDQGRVAQVLSNLLGNAMKFTPEGGQITLLAEPREHEVLLSIADTGPGIHEQDLPYVFDRFWQARRARRGGVGLGLPITKGIVEAHGGRLWVESTPGMGTTFYLTLPRADEG